MWYVPHYICGIQRGRVPECVTVQLSGKEETLIRKSEKRGKAKVCYSEAERKEEAKKILEKRLEKRENT